MIAYPLSMKHYKRLLISFEPYEQTLRSKKCLIYLPNHTDLSMPRTKRNGSYRFQKGSATAAARYNTHSE